MLYQKETNVWDYIPTILLKCEKYFELLNLWYLDDRWQMYGRDGNNDNFLYKFWHEMTSIS